MRLIDADELKTILSIRRTIETIQHAVDNAPTVDAVLVVRCKECQYYHQTFCEIWSKYGTIQTREQGFCYMVERRDDE